MNTLLLLQQSLNTIETNLFTEISIVELAEDIGFSTDHFQRVFKEYVGMPVKVYVNKRRMEHALLRMVNGESIVDTALYCGFDTHAGFYKAFRRQFGCSPTKYLKLNTVGPTTPINLLKESKKIMTKNEILKILNCWNTSIKAIDIDRLDLSQSPHKNHTYNIGNQYIFKSGVNMNWLHTHLKMIHALKDQGVIVPYPIQTTDGRDYIIIDNVYYMLLHRIEGDILTLEQQFGENCHQIGFNVGEGLAKLHLVLKDIEDDLDVTVCNTHNQMLNWAIPNGKKLVNQWNVKLPEGFFDTLEAQIKDNFSSLPVQLIHRDPNPRNYIFKDGVLTGFIDFEISEKNIRLFDICYALTGLFIDTNQVNNGIKKWLSIKEGLLTGYESINPLLDIEKEMIPSLIYSIQLIFIAYLQGFDDQLDMLKRNLTMLEELSEIFA